MPILSDLELSIAPGTLTLIEGANGAGKTTLLRLIAGLLVADEGQIRVCGRTLEERLTYQREIGLASAGNAGLYARLHARQHLLFAARIGLVPRDRQPSIVDRSMRRFGLSDFGSQRVDRLSMGQRQRLRLALAFLHEPHLVLLDEPFTSLDPGGRALLIDAIDAQRAAGRSVLWCGPADEVRGSAVGDRLSLAGGTLTPA